MKPQMEAFTPREIGQKPWGTELLIACTEHYIGKILTMRAGHRGGLQYHTHKDETFHLVSGRARVKSDGGTGNPLITHLMRAGESYHVPPGAVHQVEAVTDCVFFETSTPHFEDRVNVGSEYGCADTGESW